MTRASANKRAGGTGVSPVPAEASCANVSLTVPASSFLATVALPRDVRLWFATPFTAATRVSRFLLAGILMRHANVAQAQDDQAFSRAGRSARMHLLDIGESFGPTTVIHAPLATFPGPTALTSPQALATRQCHPSHYSLVRASASARAAACCCASSASFCAN
jgi:hypothetical protein